MRMFLTILEGPTPSDAEAIFATEDPELIDLVGSWVARRLDRDPAGEELNRPLDGFERLGGTDVS